MESCKNKKCNNTFSKEEGHHLKRFCSEKCQLEFNAARRAEYAKESSASFKKSIKVNYYQKHPKRDIKLISVNVIGQYSTQAFQAWMRKLDIKKTYTMKKIMFERTGCLVERQVKCLAISLKDIEEAITKLGQRLKKTGNITLRETINRVKEYRKLWLLELRKL